MWMEKTKTGYAFRETYVEPLTGKRKKVSVTMPSKSNMAKKAAAEKLQLMIQEKTHCQGTDALLFDIIQSYINSRQGFVKDSTLLGYQMVQKRLHEYFPEDTQVQLITPVYLQDVITRLVKRFSYAYGKKVYTVLNASFLLAERLGQIDSADVVRRISVPKPPQSVEDVEHKREKFLSRKELHDVLSRIREKSPTVALICEFQSLTGLRFGELAALRDKDYDGHEIYVNATLVWARKKGDIPHRGSPKNIYSIRHVKLDKRAREILEHFQLRNKRRRLWEPTQHDKDDESYIFTNTDGGPIDLSYVNKILRQIHYNKHLSTHIFRHTHISILAEAGVSLKAIMQRVGHNEPATTLSVYTHVTDAMENEAVEAIEKIT